MALSRELHPSIFRETVTVDGIVVPSAWNEDGAITGVSINTFDERSYRRVDKGVGEKTTVSKPFRMKIAGGL